MKIKTAWFVLFGALVVALPVRIYQMLFLVDPKTGFFTDQNITAICMAVFMVVVSAIIIFMCFRDKNAPKRFEPISNIPAAIAAAAGGIAIIVHSIIALIIDNNPSNDTLSRDAAQAASSLQGGQAYLNVIMAFVGVAAGAVILIAAYDFTFSKNLFKSIPIVAAIPPLWFCINLITLFTNYTNVTYMTENMMDMFSMILVTLFLLAQGKMFARVHPVKTGKRMYAFGLPTILYGFVSALPSFVLQALGMTQTSSLKLTLNIVIFLIAVYALIFLLIYPKIPNYRKELIEEEKKVRIKPDVQTRMQPEVQQQTNQQYFMEEDEEEPIMQEQVPVESIVEIEPECADDTPFVQREMPVINSMELDADLEQSVEVDPNAFDDDDMQIPYIINREPAYKMEVKVYKKLKKNQKKKNRTVFYYLPIVKKHVDKKEAEEKRPAWSPAPRTEPTTLKLENDWILDIYGYERRPLDGEAAIGDEPYIPKVIDWQEHDRIKEDGWEQED